MNSGSDGEDVSERVGEDKDCGIRHSNRREIIRNEETISSFGWIALVKGNPGCDGRRREEGMGVFSFKQFLLFMHYNEFGGGRRWPTKSLR